MTTRSTVPASVGTTTASEPSRQVAIVDQPYVLKLAVRDIVTVLVLFALEMGQLRHVLVQDTWLPEVGARCRPDRVPA